MKKKWREITAVAVMLLLSSGPLFGQLAGFESWEKGRGYYNSGDYAKAAEEFVRAYESNPSYVPYQEWLGAVLVNKLERYDQAIELLEKTPNLGKSADTLYYLGKAYYKRGESRGGDLRRGDFAKAQGYVERAYDIEPTAKARDLLKELRSKIRPEGDTIWKILGVLLVILAISVGAVVALRRFVFPQPSPLRDVILFLVLVLVMIFSAAQLGIISGQQFADIIGKMFDILKAVFPGKS